MSDAGDDQSIRELGERILAELGGEHTNDTLTRWIVHHAAELIAQADAAAAEGAADANDLAREARAAILQLWDHRSAWPEGWPPPRAAEMARLLESVPAEPSNLWRGGGLLHRLHHIHLMTLATIVYLAAAGVESNDEDWVVGFGEHLTEDEAEMLRRAVEADSWFAKWQTGLGKAADDERHPLAQLADAYREAVIALVEPTRNGEERPSPE